MSLTAAQRLTVFEMLGVVDGDNVVELADPYGVSVASSGSGDSAKARLDVLIAALTADQETRVAAIVAAWDAIASDTTRIEDGGAGSARGVYYNPESERGRLRERLRVVLPVFRPEGGSNSIAM